MPSFYVSLNTIYQTLNTREFDGPPPLLSVLATALHLPLVGIWRARKALGRSLRFGNVLAFGGPPFGTAPTFRKRSGIWRAALWDGPYVSETFWHLAGRPSGRPLRFGTLMGIFWDAHIQIILLQCGGLQPLSSGLLSAGLRSGRRL